MPKTKKPEAAASKAKRALLILGMHRSGTSAFTRMCNLLGAELGDSLLPPKNDNEAGFWEHRDIVDIHDRLLEQLHSSWDNTSLLPDKWWQKKEVKPYADAIAKILKRDFAQASLFAVKDPRLSLLVPMWVDILAGLKIEPVFAIVVRNPESSAQSLRKRNNFPPEKSLLLWAEYNLQAEYGSRGFKRSFISFDGLFSDWQSLAAKVAKDLDIKWPHQAKNIAKDMEAFLKPTLLHSNNAKIKIKNGEIKSWSQSVFKIINEAITGNIDEKAFDNVRGKIAKSLKSAEGLLGFWIEEAMEGRKQAAELHETNLKYLELQGRENEHKAVKKALQEARVKMEKMHRHILDLDKRSADAEWLLDRLLESTSWRITAPLRAIITLFRAARDRSMYMRIYGIIRTQGLFSFLRYMRAYVARREFTREMYKRAGWDYHHWVMEYDTIAEEDRVLIKNHIRRFAYKPLISVVMPVYNVEEAWLRGAIESVRRQLYENWQLCIADDASTEPHVQEILKEYKAKDKRIEVVFRDKNGHISACSNSALALAKGEFVVFLDHDDVLCEHAIYHVVNELNQHPEADIIYSDEDKIDNEGQRFDHFMKPDWNPDLFYSQNMINHLGCYRRELLKKAGGFRTGFEGAQDYDLILRCLPHTAYDKIRHIPHILYHWRAISGSTALEPEEKDYTVETARKALQEYFNKHHKGVKVRGSRYSGYHHVVWPVPKKEPLISLIIPTRNRIVLIRQCVQSILEKTLYKNYEIIVVDNQSDEPETLEYLRQIQKYENVRVLEYDKPFNYSAINNFAIKQARGELIGLINNDIEVITPEWLSEMAGHALRPDVGAVGAKLYYPDDTVQHGGVVTGIGAYKNAVAGHLLYKIPRDDFGYFGRAVLAQTLSAVTAACLIIRKSIYEEVGGLDEENLAIAFNDVDFCLKVREKGYRNIWTPYAELYHHESASRGLEDTPEKLARFAREVSVMRERWGEALDNDPYFSPNLDLVKANFTLAFPPRAKKPWLEKQEENSKQDKKAA